MSSFVTTDSKGNFILDGKPWFLHGATYFGRRPGTCGGDWLGENFAHNLSFLDRDLETMHRLGLNTLGLFVSNPGFFNGIKPEEERFEQLGVFLDKIGAAGIKAVMFDLWVFPRETWCAAKDLEPGTEFWNPAVNPEAERATITAKRLFRQRFADRTEIIGWATGCPRFFGYGYDVPPVGDAWMAWLQRRFDGDFNLVRELFALEADETDWGLVRMPTEMKQYFNHHNPRSYEFAVMQQTLVTKAVNRIARSVREVTPHHLMITDMEGCCFSGGHFTSFIPEKIEADALWLESYHWEGMRSYPFQDPAQPAIMPEPATNKPSVAILNAAGYVQMLTQLMKRSGKPLILCHGVDIGEKKRGVRSEEDQYLLLDRYNTYFLASGGHGLNYWCWSDDELSKTYTIQFGVEYDIDTDPSKKKYWQAGETMGIVRYDGSERPVAAKIADLSNRMSGKPVESSPGEVLVLMPSPVFQSVYRYRANLSAFGVFTSLARVGMMADAMMSSAGEEVIGLDEIIPYKLVVLGANTYRLDHIGIPGILLEYVKRGGTLFIPLASHDTISDPYLKSRKSEALRELSGCLSLAVEECHALKDIHAKHQSFGNGMAAEWKLETDEPVFFSRVRTVPGAEVLAAAAGLPLLYRHRVGAGTVYVYTWNLDVFIYEGGTLDHYSDSWDWIWSGIAAAEGLNRDLQNPIRRVILEMSQELGVKNEN